MNVCLVSHSAQLGGAEMVLLETIDVLQESGAKCCVILPGRGPLIAKLQKIGCPVFVTSSALWTSRGKPSLPSRVRAGLNMLCKALVLAWRAWQWKSDLIYSNTATVCVGAMAAALLGLPHVWHVHEFAASCGLDFIFGENRSYWIMDRLSSMVLVPSQALASQLSCRLSRTSPQVVYCSMHRTPDVNGGGTRARHGAYRCVLTGAITQNKGQEDAVLAMEQLRQRRIDAELLVIGDGDQNEHQRLERLVAQSEVEDRVRFLGYVADPVAHLRSADAALICSRSEALGRVTAEAMLAGKPVIGADNSATMDLIRHGVTGLLYRTGNPRDLAEKIAYLHDHPEMAARVARAGEVLAKRLFNREAYSERVVPLLMQLAGLRRQAKT